MAAYWGIQGTGPNENVSKLETDRQTGRLTKAVNKDKQTQTRKGEKQ